MTSQFSDVTPIFFYKGLTRYPEIGNTPVWVLPNIWRLRRVVDSKFVMNVLIKCCWMLQRFQGYSFYHFRVIKGISTRGEGGGFTPSPRLGLRRHRDSCTEKFTMDGNFTAILKGFAKIDLVLDDHLRNGPKNAQMNSWKIQNEVIACIAEVLWRHIRYALDNSMYFSVIANEVTNAMSKRDPISLFTIGEFTIGETYHSGNIFRLNTYAGKAYGCSNLESHS